MFQTIRTALKLAGTVVELNERLTALESNFDILDRAVKREGARVRAENSRLRRSQEPTEEGPTESNSVTSHKPIGGVMRRQNAG
jgi:hypothetical protein